MQFEIKYARAMPQAQVRFRNRFKGIMETTAARIGAIVLRAAEDDIVPVENISDVTRQAIEEIDRLFVGRDGRTAIDRDGRPLSPYARILLEEVGRVTYEVVAAHSQYIRKTMPGEVRLWLTTDGVRVREMGMARQAPTIISELTIDEIRERFPSLTEEDIETVSDLRLFDSNPLAEYEAAHTWVDPRGYRLSDRIWRTDQETRKKLNDLLTDAIASGQSAKAIAALVEQYLIPGREGVRTNKPYGTDGSYDAMRLGRTEISHAANQASYISSYLNPYVDKIEVVRSANGDPTCTVCPQHATIGMSGERLRPAYSVHAANIPPYHPHDMCRVQPVVTDSPEVVAERLRRGLEISRQVNLAPMVNPVQVDAFTQQLLGEIIWSVVRQVLPLQPRLL